jgi:hypothetical protein
MAISKAKAVMLDMPGMLVRMARRSERLALGFDRLENDRFDCRNLAIDLFETLSVLTLQQGERESFSAVLGGGAILHQGLASDVEFLQFKQDLASGWTRLQFQQCAHARQNRRIQAIGLR